MMTKGKSTVGSSIIRGSSLTSLAALVGLCLDFTFFVIAIRSVSISEFGVYSLFLVVGRFAQVLADFGFKPACIHFLSSEKLHQKESFGTALGLQTVSIAAVIMALLLVSKPVSLLLGKSATIITLYLALLVTAQSFHSLFSGALQGLRLYHRYVVGELVRPAARLLSLLFFLKWLELGFPGLIFSTILAPFLAGILQFALIPLPKKPIFCLEKWKSFFLFSYPLGANSFLGITFDRISRLILGISAGPASVALLETASRIPEAFKQVYMGFQSVFFPNMSRLLGKGDVLYAGEIITNSLRLVSFLTAVITITILPFRNTIITLLFSRTYMEASLGLVLLMADLNIALINNIMHTGLVASGNSRYAFYAGTIQCVANVALYLALIPIFGYLGAIYGQIAGNILINPFYVRLLKAEGINVRISTYGRTFFLLVSAVTIGLCVSSYLVFFVIGALFIAGAIALKCVTRADLASLVAAFPAPSLLARASRR